MVKVNEIWRAYIGRTEPIGPVNKTDRMVGEKYLLDEGGGGSGGGGGRDVHR